MEKAESGPSTIILEEKDGAAVITLNRPAKAQCYGHGDAIRAV